MSALRFKISQAHKKFETLIRHTKKVNIFENRCFDSPYEGIRFQSL